MTLTVFTKVQDISRWLEPRIEGPPPPKDNPYVPIDIKFINDLCVPDVYGYLLKEINGLTIFTKCAGERMVQESLVWLI